MKLLTKQDIENMRFELLMDSHFPKISPPKGREYWDVERIVKTLEQMMKILDDKGIQWL